MLRAALISTVCAAPAAAAPVCETRDWAAHTHDHRDLGEGRVAWDWSWELEGIANDIHVVDCRTHAGLTARARSERMNSPLAYDRRTRARRVLQDASAAPLFFRFDNLSDALHDIRVPSERLALTQEPCACEAFYPGLWDATAPETRDP